MYRKRPHLRYTRADDQYRRSNETFDVRRRKTMRWADIRANLLDFWQEFRQVKSGIVSVVLLGLFVFMIFIEPYIIRF